MMKTLITSAKAFAAALMMTLAFSAVGCGDSAPTVIEQPENAMQEMEDYGAQMDAEAGKQYGAE